MYKGNDFRAESTILEKPVKSDHHRVNNYYKSSLIFHDFGQYTDLRMMITATRIIPNVE